jgi:hypothetical protein
MGEITADVVKKLRDHGNRIERLEKVEYPKCAALSSNPGETASALTTDQAGTLTLHKLTFTHLVKGATEGYIYVPLTDVLSSASWDGDEYYDGNDEASIDLSAVFGAPAGIKSVKLMIILRCAATGYHLLLGPDSSHHGMADLYITVANEYHSFQVDVTCDASGDVYFECTAVNATKMNVWMVVVGYHI